MRYEIFYVPRCGTWMGAVFGFRQINKSKSRAMNNEVNDSVGNESWAAPKSGGFQALRFVLILAAAVAGQSLPHLWHSSRMGQYEVVVLIFVGLMVSQFVLTRYFTMRGQLKAVAQLLAEREMLSMVLLGGVMALLNALWG